MIPAHKGRQILRNGISLGKHSLQLMRLYKVMKKFGVLKFGVPEVEEYLMNRV